MVDNNPERQTKSEEKLDTKKVHEQLERAAKTYLHGLQDMDAQGIKASTYYAEYLASYMLWISSERIENLTKRLNILTIALIILTAILIGLTVTAKLLP
jgi:hypothetical protein